MIDWFENVNDSVLSNSKVLLTHKYIDIPNLIKYICDKNIYNKQNACLFIFGYNFDTKIIDSYIYNLSKISNISCIYIVDKKCNKDINNITEDISCKFNFINKIDKNVFKELKKENVTNIFNVFDIKCLNDINFISKNIKCINKNCIKNDICFGISYAHNIIYGNIIVPNDFKYCSTKDMNIVNDIANLNICYNINSKKDLYEYLYDVLCNYFDNEFVKNHYCDFCNDKCIANRKNIIKEKRFGCCYYFKYKGLLTFENEGICKYQVNRQCQIKSISCKIFTCSYYKKMGITFNLDNITLTKEFFTNKQRLILKYNYYIDKKYIIDKLLEKSIIPYYLYYLTRSYYVNNK